ncbi:hypothetical protein CRYUN_Cryun20dG0023700 [Craigia yunnanensis]
MLSGPSPLPLSNPLNSALPGLVQRLSNSSVRPQDRNGGNTENVFSLGCLSYVPPQSKDLNIFLTTGKFPDTDSYIRKVSSPVFFDAPPINSCCPESILRSAAKSFKNTPSIIRKRSCQTTRQTSNNNISDGVPSNAQQLFPSPPKSPKLESTAVIKSVEKRLKYAFDEIVQDSSSNITRTSAAVHSSSTNST